MKSVLIFLFVILANINPVVTTSEETSTFDVTFFDQNADGVDDRMDFLIHDDKDVAVILMLSTKPTELHLSYIENIELEVTHIYKYINAIRIDTVPANKIDDLKNIDDVKIVEWQAPVYKFLDTAVRAIKVQGSDEYSPVVWDKGLYGEGINVAVLDTGVDNEHETFGEYEDQGVRRFIAGMNCDGGCPTDDNGNYQFTTEEDSNEDPDDFDGHGTHVASTVLGTGGDEGDGNSCESDEECIGVAPAARLIDMKVMADWGSGSSADINEAIEACIENVNTDWENDGEKNNGIQIMSMSLGTTSGSDGSDTQSQLVNQANAAGIAVIIAMGNDGDEEVPSPAAADWSIAVGAMDNNENVNRDDDDLASYSNYGPRDDDGDNDRWDELKPSVVAPGSDIRAALGHSNLFGESNAQGWTTMSGTSMATPIVAGLAALLLEADSSLAPTSNSNGVRDRLQDYSEAWDGEHDGSASEPGESDKYNYYYGYGYIDGYEIVDINQPDAIITEISITPDEPVEGDTVTISVEIKNQGTMDIDSSSIKIMANDEELEDESLGSISVDSDIIWTYDWMPDEGDYELNVEVYDVNPSENDLDNNVIEEQISVSEAPAEGVDLAITQVWTDDNNSTHNEHINVYAKIKNQGTEKATDFEIWWYDDGSKFATIEGEEIDVEQEITISGEWIAKEGESNLAARLVEIQPNDQNGNNDQRAFNIDVGPPPEEPDFVPTNLRTEGILEENQDITIIFDIMNIGKTKGDIDYTLKIGSETVYSGKAEVSGESEMSESYSWNAVKGNHILSVILDNSDPSETSEDNNDMQIEIDVEESMPKFNLLSISWDGQIYNQVEKIITITLENYGGEEGDVRITFYESEEIVKQITITIPSGTEMEQDFQWIPREIGKTYLSAQIDYEDKIIGKNAYVLDSEEENEIPITEVSVEINGLQKTNPLIINANSGDIITFDSTESFDEDGNIVKYKWEISMNSAIIIDGNQEIIEYLFTETGVYNTKLTITDDDGAQNTWQASVIINQKETEANSQNSNDGISNTTIIGGISIAGLTLAGLGGLRYLRNGESDDDYFDFDDMGAINLSCPNCNGLISITTTQRPIQVGCPMCQSQFVIRE